MNWVILLFMTSILLLLIYNLHGKEGSISIISLSVYIYVYYLKAQPHAAMLHTCDGVFQSYCDAGKTHAMCCDAFSNMLEFLPPILEYVSHLLSDFETVYSIAMVIS